MTIARGRQLAVLGDCVLGAMVAESLALKPDDSLVSSPESLFDLAGVYPLKMKVAGILEKSYTSDDRAVFVDLKTAWIIQGLGHGHQDVTRLKDPTLVLKRTESNVAATAKLFHYTEISEKNMASFHFHGNLSAYPISAVIAVPYILFIIGFSIHDGAAADPLNVYVVNYPLKYFAQRIGGDHARVHFPVPADVDPAFWNPDLADISAFQKADLILLNGAGYARWVNKVSLPRSKIVDTSRQFKDHYLFTKEVVTHSHGTEEKHAHEALAFTTWLDLTLAARQAEAIAAAMGRKRPDLQNVFQNNFEALAGNLKALDLDIQAIVSQKPSTPLIVSHPVYDYFARRYGLDIESVHWEPDQFPAAEQWTTLKAILKRHPAKWMIWEGEPVKVSSDRLKTHGIGSLVFDPCDNVPDQGDFLSVMRRNVQDLRKAF